MSHDNTASILGTTNPDTGVPLTRGEAIGLIVTDLEAIREGAIRAVAMFSEDEDPAPVAAAALGLARHLVSYTAMLNAAVAQHDQQQDAIDDACATVTVPDTLEGLTD